MPKIPPSRNQNQAILFLLADFLTVGFSILAFLLTDFLTIGCNIPAFLLTNFVGILGTPPVFRGFSFFWISCAISCISGLTSFFTFLISHWGNKKAPKPLAK